MIFQQIEISNLFSYYDRIIFDLTGQQPGRPIVLISGRNGFGKTSFINAIKLLFTGPIEDMRENVQSRRKLSAKNYMLGHGKEWMGVFNRQARKRRGAVYDVRCQWREADGVVTVQRAWYPDGEFVPDGHLTIQSTMFETSLEGAEAQRFLEKRLPAAYLPYFFFNGEDVQKLAEGNRERTRVEMEGILNIAPVETLVHYLDKVKRSWAREGSVGEEQRKFNELCRAWETLNDQLSSLADQRVVLCGEIEILDGRVTDLERRMRAMQGFKAQTEEVHHKRELEQVRAELEKARQEVMERFVPEAPLVVNPGLMQTLLTQLEQDDQDLLVKRELLDYLYQYLPLQVFERPSPPAVRLRDDQKAFYLKRLQESLDKKMLHEGSENDKTVLSLRPLRPDELRRLLIRLVDANPLHDHGHRLKEVSRLVRREVELQQQLDGISTVVDADRERYMQMQENLKNVRQQRDLHQQKLGGIEKECERTERERERVQKERDEQEKRIVRVSIYQKHGQQAEALIALYRAYKVALKNQRQGALQEAINRHYKALMTSHDLVDQIRVDEDFGLHFLDSSGEPLGGANLSAGMKQLVAVALQWALKDVSGKSVPVIVDTPLARIDRQNQENLLQKYFPHVAEQIVLLPTNSELDLEKYRLLSPYIYREYRLDNPHGDHAQAVESPMYEV